METDLDASIRNSSDATDGVLLGLDLGSRRTGTALYRYDTRLTLPLGMIEAATFPPLLHGIEKLIAEYGVTTVVAGLPLNTDGSEGNQAAWCRKFGRFFNFRCTLPLFWYDERLTSLAADAILAEMLGMDQDRKAVQARRRIRKIDRSRDARAAALILEGYVRSLT